jgi:hypothetical protein
MNLPPFKLGQRVRYIAWCDEPMGLFTTGKIVQVTPGGSICVAIDVHPPHRLVWFETDETDRLELEPKSQA